MSDEREKYAAYPHTVLAFAGATPFRVDLRVPLGDADRARLAALPVATPFAVFTAENPEGENAEDAEDPAQVRARARANRDRTRALVETLEADGVPYVRVDGTAPEGDYCERCVAVALSLEEAAGLAARERQLALFWYDGETFWLIPAEADEPPRRLPVPEDAAASADSGAEGGTG